MPSYVRPDVITRAYQLPAYTTVGTTQVRPWPNVAAAAEAARGPIGGIILQMPRASVASANVPGTWIEYGGPDITPGNGLVLEPGDQAPVAVPNAAAIWIVPSVAGLKLRGQIQ